MATNKYVSLDKLSHFLLQLKQIIPSKTSQLTNDSNYVSDASYVHTDANFTQTEKISLVELKTVQTNIPFQWQRLLFLAVSR